MEQNSNNNHTNDSQSSDKDAPIFEVSLPDLEKFLKRYELAHIRSTVLERSTILILSASGFIAALAWDEALKSFFRNIAGFGATTGGKFIYALIVTAIAIILSAFLSRKVVEKRSKDL